MKVKFVPQNIELDVTPDKTLLQIATENGIEIKSICKGVPSCAECRIRVIEGDSNVLPPNKSELELIGTNWRIDSRRLACQIRCYGDIVVDMKEQIERQENQSKKVRGYRSSKQMETQAVQDTMILTERPELKADTRTSEPREQREPREAREPREPQQGKPQSQQQRQKNQGKQQQGRGQGGGPNSGQGKQQQSKQPQNQNKQPQNSQGKQQQPQGKQQGSQGKQVNRPQGNQGQQSKQANPTGQRNPSRDPNPRDPNQRDHDMAPRHAANPGNVKPTQPNAENPHKAESQPKVETQPKPGNKKEGTPT